MRTNQDAHPDPVAAESVGPIGYASVVEEAESAGQTDCAWGVEEAVETAGHDVAAVSPSHYDRFAPMALQGLALAHLDEVVLAESVDELCPWTT